MYRDYQDEYGLIHLRENPPLDESENTPLFCSASFLLMRLNGTSREGMLEPDFTVFKNNGQFHTYPNGDDNRCSHDNMTGLYIAKALGLHNMELPIMKWDSYTRDGAFERKYWLHPRDIIFYSSMSGSIIGKALLPILLFISLASWKKKGTSGKCLWFYRFTTMTLSKSLWVESIGQVGLLIGEALMKSQHGDKAYIDVFKRYYKDDNHPVNQEIRKWYE